MNAALRLKTFGLSLAAGVGGMLVVIVMATLVCRQASKVAETREKTRERQMIGRPAPDVCTTRLDGGSWCVAAQRGRVVVVDFWATWCVPCRRLAPQLQRMHDDYGDEVLLVSVALDEESKAVKSVLSEYPSDWVQVHEPRSGFNGQLAKAFRVSAIPAFCVIGADGRMLGVNMDLDEARELLAGLVNQQRESDAGFAKH